ncbi:MAG: hypothetical protein FJ280_26580 [Planctomycetes bacterium]|nr:hypothetical protein [Planctomycetota bacterium]
MSDRKSDSRRREVGITRRRLLGGAAAAAAFSVVPHRVLGGQAAPSEKVNVAIIGTGGQGIVNMKQLFTEPDVRIATLCDLNEESDYSLFYHGGTAGPLTEFVLMGNVALRSGKKLDFDARNLKVTNVPEANQFLQPDYRAGRSL